MIAPIPMYVGYEWVVPVKLVDPTTGAPIDISAWSLFGDLYVPGQTQPTRLPAQNVSVPQASFQIVVPKSVTSTVVPQSPSKARPCQILINYLSSGVGDPVALAPIPILPLDPARSS